jgi:integrase
MRNLITFAVFSGMRPRELFALEWRDVDMEAMRIHVQRRVYRGRTDLPKSNRTRLIALTPPARDALLGQPHDGDLVFTAKRGGQLSRPRSRCTGGKVFAAAGLDFDFSMATKHWCVHHLFAELGASPRAIAEQMGWALPTTLKMLAIYGHGDVGALEEVDRAFGANVKPLPVAS